MNYKACYFLLLQHLYLQCRCYNIRLVVSTIPCSCYVGAYIQLNLFTTSKHYWKLHRLVHNTIYMSMCVETDLDSILAPAGFTYCIVSWFNFSLVVVYKNLLYSKQVRVPSTLEYVQAVPFGFSILYDTLLWDLEPLPSQVWNPKSSVLCRLSSQEGCLCAMEWLQSEG